MTKEEFRNRLWEITEQIKALTDEVGDMLLGAVNQTKWVTEGAEIPIHLFLFTAQTFTENMDELQTWFE
jgi:hypothetical protein